MLLKYSLSEDYVLELIPLFEKIIV